MTIQHQQQGHRGEFFVENDTQQRIAELTYFWNDDTQFIIDHTWVDQSLRGQGVAKQLFDAAVNFAREKNVKILPLCSYAVVMFQRDQQAQDVLAKN